MTPIFSFAFVIVRTELAIRILLLPTFSKVLYAAMTLTLAFLLQRSLRLSQATDSSERLPEEKSDTG